jgi:hypothetical protein
VHFSALEGVHDIWIHGRIPRDVVSRYPFVIGDLLAKPSSQPVCHAKVFLQREESHSNYAIDS